MTFRTIRQKQRSNQKPLKPRKALSHHMGLILIQDYKEDLFLLHNEDLRFCNKQAYKIMTTTNKPVYLPHRTIPRQLQENALIHG